VRGGYGLFYLGQNEAGSLQGFSRSSSAPISVDGNLRPAVNLTNAFALLPGGRLLQPVGSSLGAASFLGEAVTSNFINRSLPYSHQYSIDVQHELPWQLLVEVGYVGNTLRGLPVGSQVNVIPADQLGRPSSYYTERVPNPMAGRIPNNATKNGATTPRQELLLPFPQYGNIVQNNNPIGKQQYHGLLVKGTKRLSGGVSFLTAYTFGRNIETRSLLNPQDYVLADPTQTQLQSLRGDQIDIPHKFVVAGTFELPFGQGKPVGNNWSKPLQYLAGGWQFNANITYQSGWVVNYPNAAQARSGSPTLDSGEQSLTRLFDTTLWDDANGRRVARQAPFTLRDFPLRFDDVRVPGYRNWDASLSKVFPIKEQIRAQFRFEAVNAFNTPWFSQLQGGTLDVASPAFGQLNPVQRNLPRFLKLGLHLYW